MAWIAEAYPVILVVYDAARERGFYLLIQDYFANPDAFGKLRGATVTLSIPTKNRLNEKALRAFGRSKAGILAPEGD